MVASELKQNTYLQARYGQSRVKQTAIRLSELNKLGAYHEVVSEKEASIFLYALAASGGTKNVIEAVSQEHLIVDEQGIRFTDALKDILSDPQYIRRNIEGIQIRKNSASIDFIDGTGRHFDNGNTDTGMVWEVFPREFLISFSYEVVYHNGSRWMSA